MKQDEKIFFVLCIQLREIGIRPREVVHLLHELIPHKRCWYYLDKWSGMGFYDCGVTLDLGWFYKDKLPQRYRELLEV